jgi:hypothetical protein
LPPGNKERRAGSNLHSTPTTTPARIGGDDAAKGAGIGRQIPFEDGLAGMIEDENDHASCVQIDAA